MTFPPTRRGVTAALLTAAAATGAQAQTSDIAASLARYMRRMSTFGWCGQVLAARGGQLVLDEAYGWADKRGRRRMSATTAIGIASASKQFTAAAILKLAEAGALSLDAPIGTYLRDAPPDKAALTLDHILNHTSGLPPGDLAEDFEATSREDMLARVYAAPLEGAPGERWRYSNAGYNLAAAAIEAASGRSYEDFLVSALFAPAGLTNTGFAFHSSLPRNPANAYRSWLDQGGPSSWPRKNWRPWGGGTVFSTARDFYRWQQALEGGRILSAASVARLIDPSARSAPDGPLDYAYGAFITHGDTHLVERDGDWERGYNAAWHRWPDEDLTLIIVSNSVTPGNVSMRQCVQSELELLLRGTALQQEPAEGETLARARRHRLEGQYTAADGSRVMLVDDGAYLWIAAQSQQAVELMLPGAPPERRDAYRVATAKTEQLLSSPTREAFATALTVERADLLDEFWTDWSALIAQHGELQSQTVLGTVRAGPGARTVTRLTFARGEIVAQFRWAEFGAGRLVGASYFPPTAPAPFGCVLAANGEDMIAYDTLSGSRFAVQQPTRRQLRIGDSTLERV